MSVTGTITGQGAAGDQAEDKRLWQAAHDLEGVFVTQLFRAMHRNVPQGEGVAGLSLGEDLFSSMLDEVLGQLAAQRQQGGLGDALYRQLRQDVDMPVAGKQFRSY